MRAIGGTYNFCFIQKFWRRPIFDGGDEFQVSLKQRVTWLSYLASVDVCDLDLETCPKPEEQAGAE